MHEASLGACYASLKKLIRTKNPAIAGFLGFYTVATQAEPEKINLR